MQLNIYHMVMWLSETWPFMKIVADPLLAEMPVV